ncbi:hypothetical protein ABU162_20650 [Paenibacillus thiaminolyticus]|uniref:hypothetical protein n=1 Tax=Paenibacillus thiaminolyticus TaxID=49283 RepID=UPI0035A57904
MSEISGLAAEIEAVDAMLGAGAETVQSAGELGAMHEIPCGPRGIARILPAQPSWR